MFGALTKLADSQAITGVSTSAPGTHKPSAAAAVPAAVTLPSGTTVTTVNELLAPYEDPLRELVLYSHKKHGSKEKMNELAHQAANLQNCEVITQKSEISIPNLAGIFTGTETFIKKVEETIKKKSPLIDASDSDNIGKYKKIFPCNSYVYMSIFVKYVKYITESTILGRLSRTRRAISANIRTVSARSKFSNKKLDNGGSHSDSSSFDSNININYEPIKQYDELEYAMERMTMIKESLKQTLIHNSNDSLKPIYNVKHDTECSP